MQTQENSESYLTPEYLNGLVNRYGFNRQLRGGDFSGAQQDALSLTEGFHFRNPRHKHLCMDAIRKSWNNSTQRCIISCTLETTQPKNYH